jgi:hypothetical protein
MEIRITIGKVLAVLMAITGMIGAVSNITNNTQVAMWQFNCVCWAIVALMIELRLDKAQDQYDDLVETIFDEYDKQQKEKLENELKKNEE